MMLARHAGRPVSAPSRPVESMSSRPAGDQALSWLPKPVAAVPSLPVRVAWMSLMAAGGRLQPAPPDEPPWGLVQQDGDPACLAGPGFARDFDALVALACPFSPFCHRPDPAPAIHSSASRLMPGPPGHAVGAGWCRAVGSGAGLSGWGVWGHRGGGTRRAEDKSSAEVGRWGPTTGKCFSVRGHTEMQDSTQIFGARVVEE